jgi:hypothetical protein
MAFFNYIFQLLIVFVGSAYLMPFDKDIKHETHKFRWATGTDLKQDICADVLAPPHQLNTTLEIQRWNHATREYFFYFFSRLVENKHKAICLDYIFYGAVTEGEEEATCRTNKTLFVLIGNPGVIWHPESNQCVVTKLVTKRMSNGSIGVEGKIVIFFLFCSFLNSRTCVGGETY